MKIIIVNIFWAISPSPKLSSVSAGFMYLPFRETFRAGTPRWYPPWYISLLCGPSSMPGGTCRKCHPEFFVRSSSVTHSNLLATNTPLFQRGSSLTASARLLSCNRKYLDLHRGFLSRYFLVPKKDGGLHPILDLHRLNYSLYRGKFRMLMLKSILSQVQEWDWFVTVDLKDAYIHIQVVQRHRKFLRFAFGGKAYQYKVLPFGLALAPRTLIKCMDAALAPLRLQGIRILNFLDDWLILTSSREQVIHHRDSLLLHLRALGLRLNGQKSVLTPAQQIFWGVCLGSTSMQACLTPARVETIQSCLALFKLGRQRVSGPVSQAPRPHGGSFLSSSLGAAPYEDHSSGGWSPWVFVPLGRPFAYKKCQTLVSALF